MGCLALLQGIFLAQGSNPCLCIGRWVLYHCTTGGNKAFIPSPQSDPVTKGVVYGYTVKEDNNLANKVILAGAPSKILANNFEDLYINRGVEPRTLEEIITGYSLFDAGIENPLGFVKVTFANPS